MECTLAEIVTRFERMWADFLHPRGSFEPFMDLYLERWLHSCVFHFCSPNLPPLTLIRCDAETRK